MIILASKSPRRRELLSLITQKYQVIPSEIEECSNLDEPRAIVRELACRKARSVAKDHPHDIVLGADTLVYVDSEILGKPLDKEDAVRMIRKLAGKTHEVWTGVCLVWEDRCVQDESGSLVTFCDISEKEAEEYVMHEDVLDKAGAYAIQEGAAKFVERVDGSPSGVMGLPVCLTYKLLGRIREE